MIVEKIFLGTGIGELSIIIMIIIIYRVARTAIPAPQVESETQLPPPFYEATPSGDDPSIESFLLSNNTKYFISLRLLKSGLCLLLFILSCVSKIQSPQLPRAHEGCSSQYPRSSSHKSHLSIADLATPWSLTTRLAGTVPREPSYLTSLRTPWSASVYQIV